MICGCANFASMFKDLCTSSNNLLKKSSYDLRFCIFTSNFEDQGRLVGLRCGFKRTLHWLPNINNHHGGDEDGEDNAGGGGGDDDGGGGGGDGDDEFNGEHRCIGMFVPCS